MKPERGRRRGEQRESLRCSARVHTQKAGGTKRCEPVALRPCGRRKGLSLSCHWPGRQSEQQDGFVSTAGRVHQPAGTAWREVPVSPPPCAACSAAGAAWALHSPACGYGAPSEGSGPLLPLCWQFPRSAGRTRPSAGLHGCPNPTFKTKIWPGDSSESG